MLKFLLEDVKDEYSRENFRRIELEAAVNPFLLGQFVLKEYAFPAAVTNLKVPHGLSFLPKDVILTYKTGAGALTINYANIDGTNLDLTTSGACVVRLLVGRLGA